MVQRERYLGRRFKMFHELMSRKVQNILLISSPYDGWVMEMDRGLSEAIIHEYRGLNLSRPPRLTWIDTVEDATELLKSQQIDLVIVISERFTSFPLDITDQLRKVSANIPVVKLYHRISGKLIEPLEHVPSLPLERLFIWNGDTKLFLACIKSIEDELNVIKDTNLAGIRVIIFVEDSARYLSSLLPVLYEELVKQTRRVMKKGLNEEHRLLAMRVRPKILVASSFESAMELFEQFEPYVLGVISDVRYSRNGIINDTAGFDLLDTIHKRRFDIPLLMTSSESRNANRAEQIPAAFVDKNSPTLHLDVRTFFLNRLGFGEFSFKDKDGKEISRATDLHELSIGMLTLPGDVFLNHWRCNDFSRWLYTRGESGLANEIRDVTAEEFDSNLTEMRRFLYQKIQKRRMQRQKGVIVDFHADAYDIDTEFLKIGDGSLGGKARGLAFFSYWLDLKSDVKKQFQNVDIRFPQTLVLTTGCFEEFIDTNELEPIIEQEPSDEVLTDQFRQAKLPQDTLDKLIHYLAHNSCPLAVRSSSLVEDSKYKAYAGLYATLMLTNDQEDIQGRLRQLSDAIKLVYASTYFAHPRSFSNQVGNRVEEEMMAVIIQPLVGRRYNNYFYPAVSGVAQSHNYYPFGKVRPEDGIATVALGFGQTVMEGEKALRFCPLHPEVLPQRSNVDDILKNSQRDFHTLLMGDGMQQVSSDSDSGLHRRSIYDASEEFPIRLLSSSYDAQEHSIRDTGSRNCMDILTFASILKYNLLPLPQILSALLNEGEKAMRCPVEIEFVLDFPDGDSNKAQVTILQIRPMGARDDMKKVTVSAQDQKNSFCLSHKALGNIEESSLRDILFVKPDAFDPAMTLQIAYQIGSLNREMFEQQQRYVLIGPGRWGSADSWLGIPVGWADISGVGAIVETTHPRISAEPSQGSHFFHNITSLSIPYLTVGHHPEDRLDWNWLSELNIISETQYVIHARCPDYITMKIDGKGGIGVLGKIKQ